MPITISPNFTARASNDYPDFPALTVHPYDIVLADVDGVVVFRPADLEKVLELCEKGVEVDGRCMEDIKKGRSIAEAFKEHRGK